MVVAAVIIGMLVGVLSLIPFKVATKRIRTVDPTFAPNLLGPFMLTIVISFLILVVCMFACKLLAPDYIIPFSIAEILAFIVGVIVFGFMSKRR